MLPTALGEHRQKWLALFRFVKRMSHCQSVSTQQYIEFSPYSVIITINGMPNVLGLKF